MLFVIENTLPFILIFTLIEISLPRWLAVSPRFHQFIRRMAVSIYLFALENFHIYYLHDPQKGRNKISRRYRKWWLNEPCELTELETHFGFQKSPLLFDSIAWAGWIYALVEQIGLSMLRDSLWSAAQGPASLGRSSSVLWKRTGALLLLVYLRKLVTPKWRNSLAYYSVNACADPPGPQPCLWASCRPPRTISQL